MLFERARSILADLLRDVVWSRIWSLQTDLDRDMYQVCSLAHATVSLTWTDPSGITVVMPLEHPTKQAIGLWYVISNLSLSLQSVMKGSFLENQMNMPLRGRRFMSPLHLMSGIPIRLQRNWHHLPLKKNKASCMVAIPETPHGQHDQGDVSPEDPANRNCCSE